MKIIYTALSLISAIDLLINRTLDTIAQIQCHYDLSQLFATREIASALLLILFVSLATRETYK